jgi:uncharacterized protein YbjT (DUF2867 family)
MRVMLFGATGMVGSAAMIECLDDARVTSIISVVRRSSGRTNAKLQEVLHKDFFDFSAIQTAFKDIDACFFCLGVTAAGKNEAEYTRLTYDITIAAARTLVSVSPNATFCYVTGAGTDSTEKGRSMWARVKGKTENDLLALPFKAAYMFRPGAIVPLKGVRSSTPLYQFFYVALKPFMGSLRRAFPNQVTTSVELGRAFINVAANGYPQKILDPADINVAGK